jgi:starch-binding outer membrane protein, SusD/RagB family
MKQIITTLLYSFLLFTTASCKKFLQVQPPIDTLVGDEAFSDDATATAAVTGLYSRMLGNTGSAQLATGGTSIYLGLCADELNLTSSSASLVQQYAEFANNSISSSGSNISPRFWQNPYNYIYHANACIEALQRVTTLTDATRKQLLGEMKFMRAFIYFHLVNEFGDVPLITFTDYQMASKTPRTPAAQVSAAIISDLEQAATLLSPNYPSVGKGRPNKWAAIALLSRMYLYGKQWQDALSSANDIIASAAYNLVPNLNNVFLLNSAEAILQFPTSTSSVVNSYEGNIFIPSSSTAIPAFSASASLLNAFEPGDARKTAWLKSNTVSGTTYYYPYKYKQRTNTTPATEATIPIRLAEIYLIRAEANAQLNNLVAALDDLNTVRRRAGLPNFTSGIKASILSAIEKERQVELFAEWGHRWFDLKRTGRADAVLSAVKGTFWQPTDMLFPVPDLELNRNPLLTQNPGY